MLLHKLAGAALAVFSLAATAQLAPPDPDWKEADAPPPPAFEVKRLIPFDVSVGSALRYGIDPATITLGNDGVVRYVVVARSATGAVNAMYEGLRCSTAEVRTYARYNPSGGWNAVRDTDWRSLYGNAATRHSLMFARQGGCRDKSPPQSVQDVVRSLRQQDIENQR